MTYDEIRITTRREINICEQAIKRLEKFVASMESRYGRKSDDFFQETDINAHANDRDIIRWHESVDALKRWKERLAAHEEIMKF